MFAVYPRNFETDDLQRRKFLLTRRLPILYVLKPCPGYLQLSTLAVSVLFCFSSGSQKKGQFRYEPRLVGAITHQFKCYLRLHLQLRHSQKTKKKSERTFLVSLPPSLQLRAMSCMHSELTHVCFTLSLCNQ